MGRPHILCNYENCNYKAKSKKELKNHKKEIHVC